MTAFPAVRTMRRKTIKLAFIPQNIYFAEMSRLTGTKIDPFCLMEGITLDTLKIKVGLGRGVGKLNLCRCGDRWILLFRPPGRQAGKTYFLMGEKSRKPRLFAKADTALKVASNMFTPGAGVWVSFIDIL